MKLLYKPFGIFFGLLSGFLSKKLFDVAWGRFDDAEPPKPTTQNVSFRKALIAGAMQGVVFKTTRVAVDRYGARGFYYLTGTWPGPKEQEKAGLGN